MRGKLVTTACGLALAVTLGIPAAAQAAAGRPGPADTRTTAARADASLSCAHMDDLGNNHYAGWGDSAHTQIWFGVDLSHAIPFCNVNRGNGRFWIEEEVNGHLSGECMTLIPINPTTIGEGEIPCNDGAITNTDWTGTRVGTYHSQSIWVLKDVVTSGCLYDYKQNPAIEATCQNSDVFEHFIWDALP